MIKINLVGQNYRRGVARRRAKLCFLTIVASIVLVSGGYAALVERSLVGLRRESQAAQEVSQRVQSMRKKIVALEAQKKALQPRLEALRDLAGKRLLTSQLLRVLRNAIPEEAWLLEARVVEGEIQLVGLSPSESTSAAFIHRLRETKLFADVTLSKATRREQPDGSLQEFQIKATFAPTALTGITNAVAAMKEKDPA
jgi:Tfp pilus assembly protein PilN